MVGTVGEKVVARDERGGGREFAAVVEILADLAPNVVVTLHESPDGKIGDVEAAVEPGDGVQGAVRVVGQEEAVSLRCRDRIIGADSVAVFHFIRERGGIG